MQSEISIKEAEKRCCQTSGFHIYSKQSIIKTKKKILRSQIENQIKNYEKNASKRGKMSQWGITETFHVLKSSWSTCIKYWLNNRSNPEVLGLISVIYRKRLLSVLYRRGHKCIIRVSRLGDHSLRGHYLTFGFQTFIKQMKENFLL